MMHNIYKSKFTLKYGGFVSTIIVILLAVSTLTLSLSTISAVAMYADAIYKKESRIQTSMNANACLDTVTLMVAKDYFLSGEVELARFGCKANITNSLSGNVSLIIHCELGGVTVDGREEIILTDNSVKMVSRSYY